jgi:hypothetical protein
MSPTRTNAALVPRVDVGAYRSSEVQSLCAVPRCNERAFARCPRCNRTFCAQHVDINACCPDCELDFARLSHRVGSVTGGLFGVGAAVGASYLAWLSPALGILTGGLAVLQGLLLVAVARRVARRLWLGKRRQEIVLDGASLAIAPESSEPERRRRLLRPWTNRPRGETPTPDWGMRTYGR